MKDDDLDTRRLQAQLAALPSERDPGRLVETATLTALRRRGLMNRRRVAPGWMAAGVAASLALFTAGLATGQWLGSRSVTEAVAAVQEMSAMQTAALVQQTGSDYVKALGLLVRMAEASPDRALLQGSEVALVALYEAAGQLSRITLEDPVLSSVIQVFEAAGMGSLETEDNSEPNVVWF